MNLNDQIRNESILEQYKYSNISVWNIIVQYEWRNKICDSKLLIN